MKVYVNRTPVQGPWGGGNLWTKAFHELSGFDMSVGQPDAMLIAGLDEENGMWSAELCVMAANSAHGKRPRLVIRVNECDARKGTTGVDKRLLNLSRHVDGTVFVSHWLKDYFEQKGWACKNNTVIHNGVDAEIFKPQPKFNNGKINIVAHHWSDNPMKGADIYEEIDRWVGTDEGKDFTFTYIGRHKCSFVNTKVIPPLFGKSLGDELGRYDVYVSASRFDPGPNHCLEALSCGLPTYVHKDGGGAVEFAGQNATFSDFGQLKMNLVCRRDIRADSLAYMNSYVVTSWQTCIAEYSRFLEKVMAA